MRTGALLVEDCHTTWLDLASGGAKAALSADSIDAIHIWHWIVSIFPRSWKFLSRRWQWHGRRSNGVVSISVQIQEKISMCCSCVKQSILWWTSAFQKIHCLWVKLSSAFTKSTPHFSKDFCGVH